MKAKIINISYSLLILLITILKFINSNKTTSIFVDSFDFIIKVIIPSLFPFMIFVNFILFTNTIDYLAKIFSIFSKLFNISGYGLVCIIASILGGFPYSAIIVSSFLKDNKIVKQEANRLLYFMFFPSISFLMSLYNLDNKFIYIIISLYITSFLLLFISKFFYKEDNKNVIKILPTNNFPNTYIKVMNSSISSIFSICFSIIFFRLISQSITIYINNEYIKYIISGFFEFSYSSITILSKTNNTLIDYLIVNNIISFSSLSILFQYLYHIDDIQINIKKLLLFRIATCIITSLILLIII